MGILNLHLLGDLRKLGENEMVAIKGRCPQHQVSSIQEILFEPKMAHPEVQWLKVTLSLDCGCNFKMELPAKQEITRLVSRISALSSID
jgi:hypothetical protein